MMMKKMMVLAMALLMAGLLTACSGNSTKAETKKESADPAPAQAAKTELAQAPAKTRKILVAYFSRSGNTRAMAQQIQKVTGGDLFEIQTVTPYPVEYNAVTKQAKQELEAGFKPPIKEKVAQIKDYDVIFIGSPNWWGTIAPPVMTFLSEHDLSGKIVVPFITHQGSGLGRSAEDIKKMLPQATVRDGLAVWGRDVGRSQEQVDQWLQELKL